MSTRWRLALAVVGSLCWGDHSSADLITFSQSWPPRRVTAAEAAGGAPADGRVFEFRVTTDGDILSINTLQLALGSGVQLYNHSFGEADEANPPNAALVGLFPALAADSWIDTPGVTSLLGVKLPGDGLNTTYGDLTNDGPQQDFLFAHITVSPAVQHVNLSFSGVVSIAGGGGTTVYSQPFSYITPLTPFPDVPEPSTSALLAAAVGALGFLRRNRRGSVALKN
jgi:hypothetical protein